MLLEVLSCLSLIKDQYQYGSPRVIQNVHFALDAKKNDTLYIAQNETFTECKSNIPFNQSLNMVLDKPLGSIGQKIIFSYAPKTTEEDAQKKAPQIYKPSPAKLFKHEQIHSFLPPINNSYTTALLSCVPIKSSSESLNEAFTKTTQQEINDIIADWSEALDGEDYGYDKNKEQKDKDKLELTDKMIKDIESCQKTTELNDSSTKVLSKLKQFTASLTSARSKSGSTSKTQPKNTINSIPPTKSNVPTHQ